MPVPAADAASEPAPAAESAVEARENHSGEITHHQRVWQTVLGWVFGFAIWFCLALSAYYPDNVLLTWSFLAVFVLAMILRRFLETHYGINMRLFTKNLLISLVVFLVVFIILGPVTGILDVDGTQ